MPGVWSKWKIMYLDWLSIPYYYALHFLPKICSMTCSLSTESEYKSMYRTIADLLNSKKVVNKI